MSLRIHVRRFRPGDLRRILQIEETVFPEDAYSRDLFRDLYRDCGELFLVARRGRAIIGYMITCRENARAEVISIAAHPRFQRSGAGTALMRHTLSKLARLGVTSVQLMVRTDNASAISFYRRHGFAVKRRVAGYYEGGADGFRMKKLLESP